MGRSLIAGFAALGVCLLTTGFAGAQTVALKDLTTTVLRERVDKYLATPKGQDRVKPITKLAIVKADQINYEARDGKPVKLSWEYVPQGELNASQQQDVATVLETVLVNVFGDAGKLLEDADARLVLDPKVLDIRPKKNEEKPQYVRQLQVGWSLVECPSPYSCGNYCYYVPVWYYADVRTTATPSRTETSSSENGLITSRPTTVERTLTRADAPDFIPTTAGEKALAKGLREYANGQAGAALIWLCQAVELEPEDARSWAFKALAERSLGDQKAAHGSARRSAALQVLKRGPNAEAVARMLERVSSEERSFLGRMKGETMSETDARDIVTRK